MLKSEFRLGLLPIALLLSLFILTATTDSAKAVSSCSNGSCYDMPCTLNGNKSNTNCVWYAWQRWHQWGVDMPNFGNAFEWANNARSYYGVNAVGPAPALRSIMTYSEGAGHVAVVVAVNGDNITINEQICGTALPGTESGPNANSYQSRSISVNQFRQSHPSLNFIYFPGYFPNNSTITATPNPVSINSGLGATTINWNTGDNTTGQVYVTRDGGTETLFAQGSYGSQSASWIVAGATYTFQLYKGTSKVEVLNTVVVNTNPTISADPTRVQASTTLGTTTINWGTGNGTTGQVYVSKDGGTEALFAQGSSGAQPASWIVGGSAYVFLLYSGTNKSNLLATVTVNTNPVITASPNPVPTSSNLGTTIINWGTGDESIGQVYVSKDGGPEGLFAQGPYGSQSASWITSGSTYTFKLYAGTSHINILDSVTVTGS